MLLDYIDEIIRVKSCLVEQEQDLLFADLDSFEELHHIRRSTHSERQFWNQFWRNSEYPQLREARLRAFADMAEDETFHHINDNRIFYRNFEKTVAIDHWRCRQRIVGELEIDFPDLYNEIFYNNQSLIQRAIQGNDTYAIRSKQDLSHIIKLAEKTSQIVVTDSNKNEEVSTVEVSKPIIETKWQKKKAT